MTAQIVWDDPFNPPATGTVERPFTLVGQTIDIYNFDDTGVLAWRWDLLDRPLGSAAVLSSTTAAAIQLTVDIPGAYYLRLRTYSDLAALVLDDADEQIFGVAFGAPFDWQVPAAGETTQRGSRGWATPREYAIRQTQTYLAGGLQTAYAQQPTVELGGGVLAVTQAGSPVLRLDGAVGRARIPDGTLAQPGLSFITDAASGLRMSSAGKWNLVANGISMIDFSPGAVVMGERTYVPDGTAALPGLGFNFDADTGIYRIAANTLGVSVGGILKFAVAPTRIDSAVQLTTADGSAPSPGLAFASDFTTGTFLVAASVLGLAVAGVERARFTATGGQLAGNWLPSVDLTHNLGDPSFRWNNLWAGSATFTTGLFADGAVGSPSISFTADTNTGLWRAGSGIVGVTGDGLEVVRFQAPAGANPQAIFAVGAAGVPAIGFSGRSNQGIFSPSATTLAFATDQSVSYAQFIRITGHAYGVSAAGSSATSIGFYVEGTNTTTFASSRLSTAAGAGFLLSQTGATAFSGAAGISQQGVSATYVVNQTSTAAFDLIRADVTNTALGSGDQNLLNLTVGGASVFKIKNSATAAEQGQVQAPAGSATFPSLSFLGDANTGFFSAAADSIGIATAGTEFWRFNNQTLSGFQSNSVIAAPSAVGRLTLRGNIQNAAQGVITVESSSAWGGGAGVQQLGIDLNATLNQTSTAGFTGLRLALTHTAIGSGTHRFVDFTIGGTTHFAVSAGNTPGRAHASDATAAAPSYSFLGETTLGFYRPSAGRVAFATSSAARVQFTINGIEFVDAGQYLITLATNGALTYYGNISNSVAGVAHNFLNNANLSAASGTQKLVRFAAGVAQTGTAAYTGLEIDITETSTGSGNKRLLDLKVGGTSLSYFDNAGRLYVPAGTMTVPALAFAANTDTGLSDTTSIGVSGVGLIADGALSAAAVSNSGNPQFIVLAGTSSFPGLAVDQFDSGLYGAGGGEVAAIATATEAFRWTSTPQTLFAAGSASSPSISFDGDPDTGVYTGSADEMTLVAGGSKTAVVTAAAVFPGGDNATTLGTAALRWSDVFAVQTTIGDLTMRDPHPAGKRREEIAHWKLVEGLDTIHAFNIRTGKKYALALEELPMTEADHGVIERERERWEGAHA